MVSDLREGEGMVVHIRKGLFDVISAHVQQNESMRSLVGGILNDLKNLEDEIHDLSHQLKVCSTERDYWKGRALSDE